MIKLPMNNLKIKKRIKKIFTSVKCKIILIIGSKIYSENPMWYENYHAIFKY